MFNIAEELKKLPASPGVYLMHDQKDAIIYVGKAISLKNRVRQYFQPSRNVSPKIEKMISQIHHFEYIVTDSEVEALVLESNLIKEHEPKYNTMLKDDKSYPFICATVGEVYPRLILSRPGNGWRHRHAKEKYRYFGPFTSVSAAKDTLQIIQKLYHIRTCKKNLPALQETLRPCLNYHMHQCDAPCQGLISPETYQLSYKKALRFLEGDIEPVLRYLTEKMTLAAEEMRYEDAAAYRDLVESVRKTNVHQKITDTGGTDRDILAVASDGREAVVQVFFIREGLMIGRDHFQLRGVDAETPAQILQAFIQQFYAGTPFIPRELMLEYEIEDADTISAWLSQRRGMKVQLMVPKKGQKEKMVELAHKNAALVLNQDVERLQREEERTTGAMKQIADWLCLKDIHHIESYDVSHISGFQSVGSMVVFEDGRPQKSEYRKFRIRQETDGDDYASMREILTRRFEHGIKEKEELLSKDDSTGSSFVRFPDLIMMDGGAGQVHIAQDVLQQLHMEIPVCGMVKDDHHHTRSLYFCERECPVNTHAEGFYLMTRIQDEVHRFAIEYHRSLRGKVQIHSLLDDIEGIGPRRRKALMQHFVSLEKLKEASVEELMQVDLMNQMAAENVYHFFKKER